MPCKWLGFSRLAQSQRNRAMPWIAGRTNVSGFERLFINRSLRGTTRSSKAGLIAHSRKSFASGFASALKQLQRKTITSSSSRRLGNVEKQGSSFGPMTLRGKFARKSQPGRRAEGARNRKPGKNGPDCTHPAQSFHRRKAGKEMPGALEVRPGLGVSCSTAL